MLIAIGIGIILGRNTSHDDAFYSGKCNPSYFNTIQDNNEINAVAYIGQSTELILIVIVIVENGKLMEILV